MSMKIVLFFTNKCFCYIIQLVFIFYVMYYKPDRDTATLQKVYRYFRFFLLSGVIKPREARFRVEYFQAF